MVQRPVGGVARLLTTLGRADGRSVTTEKRLDIETLVPLLKKALRRGCRASRLLDVPDLLEAVYPSAHNPGLDQLEKAIRVEARLRLACESYGGEYGVAMSMLLGLAIGSHGLSLDARRARAAMHLDGPGGEPPQPETVRRWREPGLLCDIAVCLVADHAHDLGQSPNVV